tara:strand:- start:132544 stop:133092 length:549 start_codon:yes stop_codon:yes gene_type:complete
MYNPKYHDRQSTRLKGYNYGDRGNYFITIVTEERRKLFGEIKEGRMLLNSIGLIVLEEWCKTAKLREHVELDEFVIMPDHFHAIVRINYSLSDQQPGKFESPSKNLGSLIRGFKGSVMRRLKNITSIELSENIEILSEIRSLNLNRSIWQRNYYDRIIRDMRELSNTRRYIRDNPLRWKERD